MTTMTFREYRNLTPSTVSELGSELLNGIHLTAGIYTEIGELKRQTLQIRVNKDDVDRVNIKEELGDALWYIGNLCYIRKYDMSKLNGMQLPPGQETGSNLEDTLDWLIIHSSEIADGYKKWLAYGQEISYHLQEMHIAASIKCISKLCGYFGFDIHNVMYVNIAKLKKRFPNKFSRHAAINRNLGAERDILED